MQIAIGAVIYFVFELALGIVTGKLLRHRRRGQPATCAQGDIAVRLFSATCS